MPSNGQKNSSASPKPSMILSFVLGGVVITTLFYLGLVACSLIPGLAAQDLLPAIMVDKPKPEKVEDSSNLKLGIPATNLLSEKEFKNVSRELLQWKEFREYMKIFFPVALILLLSLGATLGLYFVKAQVIEVHKQIQDHLDTSLASKVDEMKSVSTTRANEIKSDLQDSLLQIEKRLDEKNAFLEKVQKLQEEMVNSTAKELREEFASLKNADFEKLKQDTKAYHEASALEILKEKPLMFQEMAMLWWLSDVPNKSKVWAEDTLTLIEKIMPRLGDKEKQFFERKKIEIMGDLHYYYTDSCLKYKEAKDGEKALDLARSLISQVMQLEGQLRAPQLENYLYTISHLSPLTESDRQTWKKLYEDNQAVIESYLTKYSRSAPQKIAHYRTFYTSLKST